MARGKKSPSPGAAIASTDDESGSEGLDRDDDAARSIAALKAMHERGLIPEAEYQRRLAKLKGPPENGG
jgi:hypothetical protein